MPPLTSLTSVTTCIRWLAIALAAFHLYTGLLGSFSALTQRGVHLGLSLILIVLIHPTRLGPGRPGTWIARMLDLAILVAIVLPLAYLLLNERYLNAERIEFVTPLTLGETVLGIAFIGVILELARRVTGLALPLMVLICLAYPNFPGLPSIFEHAGYALDLQVEIQYLSNAGIFGIPLAASTNYIALFVIFGAFLERSGLGECIMSLAMGLVGRTRGGPAKVAVVASAMHGTISGSAPANVMTVGPFTIPLMKRLGYPPHMAGAIEAAASTGGVIMPPVMGSVAFVMAQFMGVSYSTIALYALIPALLYFFGIFCTVHWAAVRLGIRGLPASEIPDWRAAVKARGHLLLPIGLLIGLMVAGFSPQYSAGYSILAVVACSWLRPASAMRLRDILAALESGGKGVILVAAATAAAGMIVGIFELTSVGVKLAQGANALAGTLLVGLLLTMVVTLLLGAGVPPSAAYIVQVAITIPMLMGFLVADGMGKQTALVLAHFFVMYFSCLAVITPPDALAAVVASGIAGAPFIKTGLVATRVAFVAFVVPFMFVYRPALLTLGTWEEIAIACAIAVCGVFVAAIAFEGVFRCRLWLVERLVAFAAAAALIAPVYAWNAVGGGLLALLLVLQYLPGRTAIADSEARVPVPEPTENAPTPPASPRPPVPLIE